MDVINLIPKDMEGTDYRGSIGYPWQDLDKRIPGQDRPLTAFQDDLQAICDEYRQKYGPIHVVVMDGYSLRPVNDNGEILWDDNYPWHTRGECVAQINGMWCGAMTHLIVRGDRPIVEQKQGADILVDDGMWAPDEPEHGENGYCRKCHSYCYGDCES